MRRTATTTHFLEDHDLSGVEDAYAVAATLGHPKGALGLWSRQARRNDPEALKTKATILPLAERHRAYFAVYDPNIVARLKQAMGSAQTPSATKTAAAATGGGCMLATLTLATTAIGAVALVSARLSR